MILAGQPSDKTNDFITSQFLGPARRPGRDGFGRSRIRSDRRGRKPVQHLLGVSAETSCAQLHKPLPRKRSSRAWRISAANYLETAVVIDASRDPIASDASMS